MKKAFVIILFAVAAYLIFSIVTHESKTADAIIYRFDFDEIDKEFWLVSEWGTYKRAYDLATLENGVLKLSEDNKGIMPFMLSKPLELQSKDVLTVKRKVKISRGNDTFSGGLAFYQTMDLDLVPEKSDGSWFSAMGDGIVLVEYSYDLINTSNRPGRDVIRFLAADWEYNDNYQLIPPIYDKWIEETLIFDMRSNLMTYKLDDKEYKLYSYKLDKNAIRILMHPFGTGIGNAVEIDYIEVTIEDKSIRGK